MAQLSDDCFAFGGELLRVEQGLALLAERIEAVVQIERVGLSDADNRVLGESVVAGIDVPPFDNSAVDGWAVRHADLQPGAESRLPAVGRAAAGDTAIDPLHPGEARRIFTGAPLPAGADTVFMQEDVRTESDLVILPSGLKRGANSRRTGEDIPVGAVALPAGRRLRPQDVALAAALGCTDLAVRRRLRVAVLSTGNELRPPGESLAPGQIYDSNRPMLVALLGRLGAAVTDLGHVSDRPAEMAILLAENAAVHDLVVTTGGVSTGDEDHTRRAMEAVGTLVHWRLAIKPGRPVAMGLVSGTPVIGLPGNPVAAFVTFVHIVRPLTALLGGETYVPPTAIPVPADFTYRKKAGRREYVRVRLVRGPSGHLVLAKYEREGAGILTSLTETDGLAELLDPVTGIEPGMSVGFLPYASLI